MGALQLSGTTAFSSRTKHICTRYHFLRELVASNKIIVSHVKTTDQLAGIFTKFLDYPKFKAILDKIINFASCIITCIEGRVFFISPRRNLGGKITCLDVPLGYVYRSALSREHWRQVLSKLEK